MPKHDQVIIKKIKQYIDIGMTNPEIAQELGTSRARIALLARRHLGGNPNYMKRKTKHAHLRGDALAYFMGHSFEETMEHFGLTRSELKSLFTVSYRLPEFANLRKDNRNKNKWSGQELATMMRYCGILRRDKIAKIINRGSARVIKEKLANLGIASRNINGANLSQFRKMFGYEPKYQICGTAGPGSFRSKRNRFVIVPWPYVVSCYEKNRHDKTLLKIFKAFAMFQRFVWGGDPWRKMLNDNRVNKFLFIIGPNTERDGET